MYLVGATVVALLQLGPADPADLLFHRVMQILDVTTRFLLSLAAAPLHWIARFLSEWGGVRIPVFKLAFRI